LLQPDPPALVSLDRSSVTRFRRQVKTYGVPLSKTAVGEFSACPARWSFKTVEHQSTGPAGPGLLLGRACHQVVADVINSDRDAGTEARVSAALENEGVAPHMLPSAIDWVLWAVELTRQRHGCVVAVEQMVRSGPVAGVTLSGRFDLVISDGSLAPLELLDWGFGRHPKFNRAEEMVADVGTSIYRTLLAVSQPSLPDRVVITDVHVPGRQALSVELTKEEVLRAWQDIQGVRDGIRALAELGHVEARPGRQCEWCSFQWRGPHSPAAAGAA